MSTTSTNLSLVKPDKSETGYWSMLNSDLDAIDALFSTATFTAGSVVFINSSGALAQDNANLFWSAANETLLTKRGSNVDSTGQPSGTFAMTIYNATNALGENGLFIKNNWVATTSTLLELGNDFVTGAYVPFWKILGDGSMLGHTSAGAAATGGAKGPGTINAKALYDDNVLVSDAYWDLYFDGVIVHRENEKEDMRVWSVGEIFQFTEEHRHLPTMPGREEWVTSAGKSVGEVISSLWYTVEVLQSQIFQMQDLLGSVKG